MICLPSGIITSSRIPAGRGFKELPLPIDGDSSHDDPIRENCRKSFEGGPSGPTVEVIGIDRDRSISKEGVVCTLPGKKSCSRDPKYFCWSPGSLLNQREKVNPAFEVLGKKQGDHCLHPWDP